MSLLVQDIAVRLDQQHARIVQLQAMVEQLSIERRIEDHNNNKLPNTATATNTANSITATTRRPYWWTHQQEVQLTVELDAATKNLRDLELLHRDTHRKTMETYDLLRQQPQPQQRYQLELLLGKTFAEVYARHALTIENMAELVIGLRPLAKQPLELSFSSTIDDFLASRLWIQLLCDHLIQLCSTTCTQQPHKEFGAISLDSSVPDIVQQAVTEATHLCEAHFLMAPPVIVTTVTTSENGNHNHIMEAGIPLVRPWLQYALVELLKNSMAVTVERNQTKTTQPQHGLHGVVVNHDDDDEEDPLLLCPIYIQVKETSRTIEIQIMDQGGGLLLLEEEDEDDEDTSNATTATTTRVDDAFFDFCQRRESKWDRMQDQQTYAMTRSPLRGLGVGLNLSRTMMVAMGGRLELHHRRRRPAAAAAVDDDIDIDILNAGMTATIVLPKPNGMDDMT
jgi:pyruvate dehydrogenase kinase 2/3/4